jgi:transposase InsO family protein
MPWEETKPMKERIKFMLDVESGVFHFREICERYGVSRKTGYKWLKRYLEGGLEALRDQSRAPHQCPHKTPKEVEEKIVKMREKHQSGPVTLGYRLERIDPQIRWPAASTIGEILKRRGQVKPRKRRRKPQALFSRHQVQTDEPNQVMTADFKGEFRTQDGRYCYPLTMQDHCARYSFCCQAMKSTSAKPARDQFERVFQEYGLPETILTDNGTPFASTGLRRLSRLSVWWIRLGIQPLLIQLGHPEQNGRHERYHRTLKQQTAFPPAANLSTQQQLFDRFRQDYNQERPHQSLGGKTPAEVYQPSKRPYPKRLPPLEYPGHYEVRRVSSNGQIKLHGKRIFLSEVLEHQAVGLEEFKEGIWSIYLGETLLGRWNEREGRVYG